MPGCLQWTESGERRSGWVVEGAFRGRNSAPDGLVSSAVANAACGRYELAAEQTNNKIQTAN